MINMSTTIFMNTEGLNLLGKNQDVPYDRAYLFTNLRGVAKRAIVMPPEQPIEWISRFGSITVSQVGKEMPNGGMNEVGLVVEQTTLWQSSYPAEPTLPAVGELQWIQLLLDTCANVEEALEAAANVRIVQPMSRLHYMVSDRKGSCVIIEFIEGKMVAYRNELLPVPVLANTPYAEACRDLEGKDNNWCSRYDEYAKNSMERFSKAAALIALPVASALSAQSAASNPIDLMFEALQAVQREDTAFSLVYDMAKLEIYYSTNQNPAQKTIQLDEMDFSPAAQVMAWNVQQCEGGRASAERYNPDLNYTIVEGFFRDPALTAAFGWNIPQEMITFMASFPDRYPTVSDNSV